MRRIDSLQILLQDSLSPRAILSDQLQDQSFDLIARRAGFGG